MYELINVDDFSNKPKILSNPHWRRYLEDLANLLREDSISIASGEFIYPVLYGYASQSHYHGVGFAQKTSASESTIRLFNRVLRGGEALLVHWDCPIAVKPASPNITIKESAPVQPTPEAAAPVAQRPQKPPRQRVAPRPSGV